MYNEELEKNEIIIEPGDRVIYVPTHANGDINHPDCEYGIVSSWNNRGIFVKYVRNGIPQMTAELTDPNDLYLEGRGRVTISVLKIFEKLIKHA